MTHSFNAKDAIKQVIDTPEWIHNAIYWNRFGSILIHHHAGQSLHQERAGSHRRPVARACRAQSPVLQGELMAILEGALSDPNVARANAGGPGYDVGRVATPPSGLMERLAAIAGDRGIDTSKRLTREQAHDRKTLRKAGV